MNDDEIMAAMSRAALSMPMHHPNNPILEAALAYGEARREQLSWRAKARGCEEADDETAPCWMGGDGEQCGRCKYRPDWNLHRRREREALKALQKLLVKAQEGR
jgi:hypothetical protein